MVRKLSWEEKAKREVERYFLTRKSGKISWKDGEKDYKEAEKVAQEWGLDYDWKKIWESENKRRRNYGKYIQKKRKTKYRKIKRLMEKLKRIEREEEEKESDGKRWVESRRKYLKPMWNKNLKKLIWIEDYSERKVNRYDVWKKMK